MVPTKIEDLFIQLKTDFSGTILEIEAGKFVADQLVPKNSIYELCPFLEASLEDLPLHEVYHLNTMLIVVDTIEYNVDLELIRAIHDVSILIHDRSSVYKHVSQLNQNRNDLILLKRELDLKNTELENLKIIAEKANEEKSRFLAVMSHEIRNPLNSILGYSEMIATEAEELSIIRYANFLTRAGKNLRVIVDDILDLSRIEAGRLELIEESISIKEVIENCVNDFRFQLKGGDLAIQLIEENTLPKFIDGDAVRITQILSNLINNAIKFTQKGIISIGIAVISEDESISTIRFYVNDTGRGMTQDQIKTIFREYEQTQARDQHNKGGAGLGLSIVKRLTEAMKGLVTVESTVNVGTKFSVDIPFRRTHLDSVEYVKSEELVTIDLIGKEILLVDDDRLNLTIMDHVLSKEGCALTLVGDGQDALELLKTKRFDAVILDINMPRMTGEELMRKNDLFTEYNKETPFIALTGNTGKTDQDRYVVLGFFNVLSKPYTFVKLIDTLKKAIYKA
ncbi:ATP-binding response regulator [Flavicella sediminum]|uniref:ATP-binding response regulator n=1 Tax=Flavicella sediminum TaxID=2585141 RepID=UPI0011202765|nr:ATP-binding protein [Flavicella sediminum]